MEVEWSGYSSLSLTIFNKFEKATPMLLTNLPVPTVCLCDLSVAFTTYYTLLYNYFSVVAWAAEQSIFDPRLTRDMLFRVCIQKMIVMDVMAEMFYNYTFMACLHARFSCNFKFGQSPFQGCEGASHFQMFLFMKSLASSQSNLFLHIL